MYNTFEGQSEWQKRKDDIILQRIEKSPEQEEALMGLSDKADTLILKVRKSNAEIEQRTR